MTWGVWRSASGFGPQIGGVVDVPASAAYTANATSFDGTNDFLDRGAALTGISSSQEGILSFWVKFTADGPDDSFIDATNNFFVWRDGSTKIKVLCLAAGGNLDITSTASVNVASGWTHVLVFWNAATAKVYIDDADSTASGTPPAAAIVLTDNTNWRLFGALDNTRRVEADIADFYLNTDDYLDLTDVTNRRKFISAAGKPVDLGADGSTPTGNQPIIFLANPFSSFETNLGYGGGFTENGTLTAAADSPSD
jgi:hypothetical protein